MCCSACGPSHGNLIRIPFDSYWRAVSMDRCPLFLCCLHAHWAKGSATAARYTWQYVVFRSCRTAFLMWLFSTCCWSHCPYLSEQAQDNIPYSTVAAGNWATLWLSGCDTTCVHLIYSSSSPCVLSVRSEHGMSPSWQGKSEKSSSQQQTMCYSQLGLDARRIIHVN